MTRPLIDAHLDLAWSALAFNRDLTQEVAEIRKRETGMTDEPSRGRNTLSLPELKKAGIYVCVATLLVRGGPNQAFKASYKRTDLDHANTTHAYAVAHSQLAYYKLLEKQGHIRMLKTARDLDAHWQLALRDPKTPLGIILSMEGADPIVTPDQAQEWWDAGLRAVGPVHYGVAHYGYGTGVIGPLSEDAYPLLSEFQRLGMIMDVTHLCDMSMGQALDAFKGNVLASHHNCRTLVNSDRQISDEQIKQIVSRGAVIGVALDAWMMFPGGWVRGQTQPDVVGMIDLVDHIDRICQIAGDVKHVGIGSDLDGGFGTEQTPRDLNTISDLQKLDGMLAGRGYADADINAIFHGNWLRFFKNALPA